MSSLKIWHQHFALELPSPTGRWEKYWFSHPHDDLWSCFQCLAQCLASGNLAGTSGERVAERKRGSGGIAEEKKRKKKRERDKGRRGVNNPTSGVDRVSEIEQPMLLCLRRLSLWKMEIKDHFHDGSCSKYYCWNPPGKVAILWDVHGKFSFPSAREANLAETFDRHSCLVLDTHFSMVTEAMSRKHMRHSSELFSLHL